MYGNGADRPCRAWGSPDALLGILPGVDLSLNLQNLHLAICRPQSYDSTAQVIGPAGGVIRAGRHKFVIPAGALHQSTAISMVAPDDRIASVRFGPAGLQFDPAHKPRLTLDYSNCLILGSPQVVYIDDNYNLLEALRSFRLLGHQVSADVEHFSRYAVAW